MLIAEDLTGDRLDTPQDDGALGRPICDVVRDVLAVLDNVLVELLVELGLEVEEEV